MRRGMLIARTAAMVAAAGLAAPAFAGIPLTLVAAGGNPAAGTTMGEVWTLSGGGLENPTIADDGRVTFGGVMGGASVTPANDRAIWQQDAMGNPQILAREGDQVPGLAAGVLYNSVAISNARTNKNGRLLVGATLLGTGIVTTGTAATGRNDNALMYGTLAGGLSVIAQRGGAAPGTMGALYDATFNSGVTFQFGSMDGSGRVLFKSTLLSGDVSGTTNNEGMWSGLPSALNLIARKGEVRPDGPIASFQFAMQMNDSGQVCYDTRYAVGGSVTLHNDHVLWIYTPGMGSTAVVREGATVPGTGGAFLDTSFTNGWSPSLGFMGFNNLGQILTTAEFLPGSGVPAVDTTNDRALIRASVAGGIEIVAREGDPAPGTDASFDGAPLSQYALNNAGQATFQCTLTGGSVTAADDFAVYVGTPGNLTLAVREGQPMPGVAGAFLGSNRFQSSQYIFNGQGTIVFSTEMTGAVTADNDNALCSWNPGTGIKILSREGDMLEISPGVFKTVASFASIISNNGDGREATFTDGGRLSTTTPD